MVKVKRIIIILAVLCSVIAVIIILVNLYQKHNNLIADTNKKISIETTDVKSIHVKILGPMVSAFYIDKQEFVVSEEKNMNTIIQNLKQYSEGHSKYSDIELSVNGYECTFNLKNGDIKTYVMNGYDLKSNHTMSDVIYSEEVVKQIRKAFHVNVNEIEKVVFYHWDDTSAEQAASEPITDEKVILKLIDIAKQEALMDAEKSMEQTKLGIEFTNKDDTTILLLLNIYKGMSSYNELLKLIPQLKEYEFLDD